MVAILFISKLFAKKYIFCWRVGVGLEKVQTRVYLFM